MVRINLGRDNSTRIGWFLATPCGAHHGFSETLSLGCKAAWNRDNCDGLVDGARKV
jgi:hypothetical protein